MALRALCLLVIALSAGAARGASDAAGAGPVAEALRQNDECAGGGAGSEQCALEALQLRGVRASGAAAEVGVNLSSCSSNAIGEMIQDISPACVRACPRLCADAVPFLALKSTHPQSRMRDLMCAHPVMLDCVLEPSNAEACGALLKELPADWGSMPKTEGSIHKACAGTSLLEEGQGAVVAALAARASRGDAAASRELLDRAMSGKWKDERCAPAKEGQTCAPNPRERWGHSNSYIYCSAHKRLSAGETSCPARRGPFSWCIEGGIGLQHGHCDDPFCRNGGAAAGDGLYCHKGAIVNCKGLNAPTTHDSCSDRSGYSSDSDCTVTEHYTCAGQHPKPYCKFTGETVSCSSRRRSYSYR